MARRRNKKNRRTNEVETQKYELPQSVEKAIKNQDKQEKWIKRIAILVIAGIFLGSIAVTSSIERSRRTKEKKEFMQGLYQNMLLSSGYTMSYSLDVEYLITTTNQSAELHYVAKEETDQVNKKKKLTLTTMGTVQGTEISTKQIYYYSDGKCLQETQYINESGEVQSTYETYEEDISYEYNPMLALANMVMEDPNEFTKKQNTLYGSVALEDIDTFLKMCPFNTLYKGIENLGCYKDQVNDIAVISDGQNIKSVTIDLGLIAWYLISNFYDEQGLNVKLNTYRITMTAQSWEAPEIVIPEIEESEST